MNEKEAKFSHYFYFKCKHEHGVAFEPTSTLDDHSDAAATSAQYNQKFN